MIKKKKFNKYVAYIYDMNIDPNISTVYDDVRIKRKPIFNIVIL